MLIYCKLHYGSKVDGDCNFFFLDTNFHLLLSASCGL